jgi:hypothetical protein
MIWFYLFWICVGLAGGTFAAICLGVDRKEDLDFDRRLTINLLSIIVGFLIGWAIFSGVQPDNGSTFGGLVAQIAASEFAARTLEPRIRRLFHRHS